MVSSPQGLQGQKSKSYNYCHLVVWFNDGVATWYHNPTVDVIHSTILMKRRFWNQHDCLIGSCFEHYDPFLRALIPIWFSGAFIFFIHQGSNIHRLLILHAALYRKYSTLNIYNWPPWMASRLEPPWKIDIRRWIQRDILLVGIHSPVCFELTLRSLYDSQSHFQICAQTSTL